MSAPDRQGTESFVSRTEYEKMVDKVKQCEADKLKVMKDQGNLMKEFNKRMQVHLEEIRMLKDVNQKLQADLQELRDLTCYLDDDRQKCRKLAREWQRFGRYTASVMRNEVANYQEKLKVLEEKQMDLSKDNAELKELCLYLDRQRESVALENRTFCSKCSQRVTSSENLSSTKQNTTGIKHFVFLFILVVPKIECFISIRFLSIDANLQELLTPRIFLFFYYNIVYAAILELDLNSVLVEVEVSSV